jgi:NAD(P)-dependent dehydrogenase (short-subunit alcohol dehydrogenase family)
MDTFELFSLKGKNVLITGGRAMYGKGATLALADAGANIYLASHSIESAQEFVKELEQTKNVKVKAVAFDQGDIRSIEKMVEFVVQDAGSIDVFVHCSRIIPKSEGPGWAQDESALAENVAVNSAASLYLLELVGKQMIAQKSGSMVVFGSMMGLIGVEKHNYDGNPQMAVGAHGHCYAVDKSGLTAWVRHAASFYGRYGVRINAVCPGGLQSDRTNPVFAQEYSKHTQLGRLANGDDIKGPVLFLASDASAYLTGLSIPVDGGYTCI